MQKGFGVIYIFIGILIIAVVAGGAYSLGKNSLKVGDSPKQVACTMDAKVCPDGSSVGRVGPNCEFTPCPSFSPKATPYEESWQNYQSGQNIDGIIMNYPKDWLVNYRKEYNLGSDYKAKYRLAFDFAPPGWNSVGSVDWMGWGILDFDVYDPQTDINQWISKYSPDNKKDLAVKEGIKIGEKPTFEVSSNVSQFGASVIFGSNYTYNLTHSQDGSDDFVKDVISRGGIFSYIHIN